MGIAEVGSGNDCKGTQLIRVATGDTFDVEPCKGCKSCRGPVAENIATRRAAEQLAPPPVMTVHDYIDHLNKALDIAIKLGRAEMEIEQLKASNEWLLKQLRAKEPWVSVDAKKGNEENLKRSVWQLEWSVRAGNVIKSMFPPDQHKTLTVVDLVAIPPVEWKRVLHCGMLILREMDEMFKELGVEWPGEWPRR